MTQINPDSINADRAASPGPKAVRDALDILLKGERIAPEEDLDVVVLTGDGSAYGMGLSATSGAMDRNLDFLYICNDNEGYGDRQRVPGPGPAK